MIIDEGDDKENKNPNNIYIETYNNNSFVVRGKTYEYRQTMRDLGGDWNKNLRRGAGWIFATKHRNAVEEFLKTESRDTTHSRNEYVNREQEYILLKKINDDQITLRKEIAELRKLVEALVKGG
jgi:hypothetical protein